MSTAIIEKDSGNPKKQTEKGPTGKCVIKPRHKNASDRIQMIQRYC